MVSSKLSPYPAYEGLELSHDQDSGLEVCTDHEAKAPEVVLSRSWSQQSPEPAWPDGLRDEKGPTQEQYGSTEVMQADVTRKRRRRKWTLAMVVIGTIIVIAAVLGGVLPAVLRNEPRDTKAIETPAIVPLVVYNGSGIAIITAEEQTFGYYQDRSQAVLEREIINGTWQASNTVTIDAAPGSPLAAIELAMYGIRYVGNSNLTNSVRSADEHGSDSCSSWTATANQ
jgi:hypothetical protein